MAGTFQTGLFLALLVCFTFAESKKTIYIGGLGAQTDTHTHWWMYTQSFPVIIEAALKEINNNPSILPDYDLQLISSDTKGEGGLALFELFKLLQQQKKKFPVLMGPSRSTVALAVAQTMDYFNMAQIVFSARSSGFANRGVYPNTFVINYLNSAFNPAKIAIMERFDWTEAATVTLNDDTHYSETAALHRDIRVAGYSLVSSTVMHLKDSDQARSAANVVAILKEKRPKVAFISVTVQALATFMCEAYKQELTKNRFKVAMVVSGPSMPDDWQSLYGNHTGCTVAELREASDGIVGIDHFYLREDGVASISGKTADNFTTWLQTLPLPASGLLPKLSPFAYDAAYAVALALDGAINAGVDIKHFDYDRADIGGAINDQMQNVNFEGVTGPISFTEGIRNGFVHIYKVDGYSNNHQRLAVYDQLTDQLTWDISWREAQP